MLMDPRLTHEWYPHMSLAWFTEHLVCPIIIITEIIKWHLCICTFFIAIEFCPGACCIKCYNLICSQESYKFGESNVTLFAVRELKIRGILGYKLFCNILYNRHLQLKSASNSSYLHYYILLRNWLHYRVGSCSYSLNMNFMKYNIWEQFKLATECLSLVHWMLQTSPLTVTPSGREKSVT